MKILGKDGKLFGKLNIIDLILILLVIAVAVFVVIRITGTEDAPLVSDELTEPNIRFEVVCRDVVPEMAQNIIDQFNADEDPMFEDPSRIFDNNKYLDARIVDIWVEESDDDSDLSVDLYFSIEGAATQNDMAYLLETQMIRYGKDYVVRTTSIVLVGVIVSMEQLNG